MKELICLLTLALVCSCQSVKQVASMATPANVQSAITVAGRAVGSQVTATDKAIVSQIATTLLSLTTATVDETTINGIAHYIPQLSNQYLRNVVTLGLINLNLALTSFGEHNQKILEYTQAVANGLRGAGF